MAIKNSHLASFAASASAAAAAALAPQFVVARPLRLQRNERTDGRRRKNASLSLLGERVEYRILVPLRADAGRPGRPLARQAGRRGRQDRQSWQTRARAQKSGRSALARRAKEDEAVGGRAATARGRVPRPRRDHAVDAALICCTLVGAEGGPSGEANSQDEAEEFQ